MTDKAAALCSLPHRLRGHIFSFIIILVQVTQISSVSDEKRGKKKNILHKSRCHVSYLILQPIAYVQDDCAKSFGPSSNEEQTSTKTSLKKPHKSFYSTDTDT